MLSSRVLSDVRIRKLKIGSLCVVRLRYFVIISLELPLSSYVLQEKKILKIIVIFNLRTAGGGGYPPLRFFTDSEKTAARITAKFAIAVHPTIRHISPPPPQKKNDDPMPPKVTPPGHIK